ncbi:type I secretion system permease/ATPase [Duganella sp. Root1480D1]|uniref:type I secretion system permease/ATPase n=1 Tax=Duganella sp. Root1480D1 TaxID=1736471 RepID=UPI00070DAF12|nr:type I secretion system permease/ATPase [Duganella sp. Root1480D1]KQZ42407.1 ABC transporter ATP-binding protein [Duganella sp. Root1480D1]
MKPLFQLLKRPLLVVAAFSFLVNLLLLAPALFMLQVFDRVLASQSKETLLVLSLGMVIALGLMLMLDYLRSRLQGVIGNLIAEQLSPVVVKAMLERSARGVGRTSAEGLRDVAALRNLFSAQGLLALFDTPWAVVYVAVIWLAHPLLGATAASASVLMLVLAVLNDRITRRGIETLQKEAAKATRYLESSLQNAEVVQSLGMSDALIGRWQGQNARVSELQGATARKSVAMAAFTRMTRQLVQIMMQALGAYLVISGEGTPGILVATTVLLGRALSPVEQVVGSWRTLAEARLGFARLTDLLGAAGEQPERMKLPAPVGRLQAQGLVFRPLQSERMILAGVTFSLEPGESLAIIGASGAGKSTLARLLTGLWTPNTGTVRLDGVDLAQWPRHELGPWLGYLPQDVELFPGTVADNIARLGEADAEKVVLAAQRAGVHALILGLPQGYDTQIDGMGVMLSPGQRQRIALARALYGDPKLLVLDEPNSNLDGAGELALADALKALSGQVTVIVVTHRSTLVQHMDKMLVLDGGRVQHFGTVAEVMQAMQPGQGRAGAQVVAMPRAAEGRA